MNITAKYILFCALAGLLVSPQAYAGATKKPDHPKKNTYHSHYLFGEYKGVLVDEQRNPVSGAVIEVKGKQIRTLTNEEGQFAIEATEGDELLITRHGYKPLRQVLGAVLSLELIIKLDETQIQLTKSQPVQQIYYTIPQQRALSSTDAVYNNELQKSPVTSYRNALTGRLAGLYSIQSSGLPGSDAASLSLRGQTPIYIIDGVVSNLALFDLEQIESVTVLKDALATAMLGVRGAKGAVLVTTRKGKAERQRISFTAQTAIQQPISWPERLGAYDYARLRNEALRNDGIDSTNSGLYYSRTALDAYRTGSDPATYPDVNYREAITNKTSLMNRYTLSATGGNRTARYFVSLEHINQSGIFKTADSASFNTNNNFKSYVIRSNVDVNVTSKLTGGIYLLGRVVNTNEPGATTATILSNLQNTPANAYPLLNSDGSFGGNQLFQNNLLAQTVGSGYRQRYFRDVLVNLYLHRNLDDVVKGLWAKAKVSYNATLLENINRSKTFAVFEKDLSGFSQFGTDGAQANGSSITDQVRTDYEEFSIGYDRTINGTHSLSGILLANRENTRDDANLPYTITGVSGRIAYSYKNKYLVEAAFGLNGSNRYFPQGSTKRGFFPSVGLGWNLDQEAFLQKIAFVNRLKLYGTFGQVGWDNPGYFVYYPRYVDGASTIFGTGAGSVTTISEGTLPNQNITWEKATKLNLGLTGSLLNHQLSFTVEYFRNRYTDLLMQRGRNSGLLGNNLPDENIGRNRYSGYELQLSWQQAVKGLQYFISINGSSLASEALHLDEVPRQYDWMRRTGQPVGQRFGYIAEGLFQSQDEINRSATTEGYIPQLGDIKYRDLNSDGIINQLDQTAIGNTKPLLFYGVSLGFSWKGFDLSALVQGVHNRDVYMSGASYWAYQNGTGQAYSHTLNRWTPQTSATATYPRLSYGTNINNQASSSYWVKNGNYLRLKNAEIGYSLPASLVGKVRIQSVRVFVNGFNLLTRASDELDGRDPEAFTGAGYPLMRLFNFGINIKF